ncbi:MAG: DNA polymerase IV, partial [Cytophagaceae bacterium]
MTTILRTLCLTLERRMVHQKVFCRRLQGWVRYYNDKRYEDGLTFSIPMQDGIELFDLLCSRMQRYQEAHQCGPLLNADVRQIGMGVSDFIPDDSVQYTLFEDNTRKDKFRQTLHDIKERFGKNSLIRATELRSESIKDLIGFGSIKDLHQW